MMSKVSIKGFISSFIDQSDYFMLRMSLVNHTGDIITSGTIHDELLTSELEMVNNIIGIGMASF